MRSIILAFLLVPFLAYGVQEYPVLGPRIVLDKDEFIFHEGKVLINKDAIESIFQSFKAWEMLDFHVFIYVQCEFCGQAHPIDYACSNPDCRQRLN